MDRMKAMGAPHNIEIINYSRYRFSIHFDLMGTEGRKYKAELELEGDASSIYDFYPHGGWSEWDALDVTTCSVIPYKV